MPRVLPPWASRHQADARHRLAQALGARDKIQKEAVQAGATLKNKGRGGLDPALALAVFRRDKWQCQIAGCKTKRERLDLDHIAGHPQEIEADPKASPDLRKQAEKPKADTLESLHVLCARHHDLCHEREDAIESDKSPPPMTR